MMWTCLRGGEEKCSDNSSKGLNRCSLWFPLGFESELRRRDWWDTLSKIRSSLKPGALTHFQEIKECYGKAISISFFTNFFSLDTARALNFNQEGLGELRSKQPRLSLPEPTIESIPWDKSDRFEPAYKSSWLWERYCEGANVNMRLWKSTARPLSIFSRSCTTNWFPHQFDCF